MKLFKFLNLHRFLILFFTPETTTKSLAHCFPCLFWLIILPPHFGLPMPTIYRKPRVKAFPSWHFHIYRLHHALLKTNLETFTTHTQSFFCFCTDFMSCVSIVWFSYQGYADLIQKLESICIIYFFFFLISWSLHK